MKVKGNVLLFIACLVWGGAGFNILRIGLGTYPDHLTAVNLILSALVFGVFGRFVFGRLVKKHTARILGYRNQPQFFLRFFDRRAFLIMAVMMTGGIAIRRLELAPQGFIAVFYSGLGAALLLAGLLFGVHFIRITLLPGQSGTI